MFTTTPIQFTKGETIFNALKRKIYNHSDLNKEKGK